MEESTSEDDERRQRILDVAAELIIHYGYDKTTVSDIAREAGVSKGTIYLHFESKEELFEALLLREVWRYGEGWLSAVEADPKGGTLGGIYKNVLQGLKSSPFMGVIFRRDARILGNYLHKPNNIFQTMQANALRVEFIQALQQAGTVRRDVDPAVIAHIMEILAYGMVGLTEQKKSTQMPPFEATIEAIAFMVDQAFTPAEGADHAAAKAAVQRITQAARKQFE